MSRLDKILELLPSGIELKIRRYGNKFQIEIIDGFKKDDWGHESIAYDIKLISKLLGVKMRIHSIPEGFKLVLEEGKFIKFD